MSNEGTENNGENTAPSTETAAAAPAPAAAPEAAPVVAAQAADPAPVAETTAAALAPAASSAVPATHIGVTVAGVKHSVAKGTKLKDFLKTIKAAAGAVVTDASGSTLTPDYVFGSDNLVLTITGRGTGS